MSKISQAKLFEYLSKHPGEDIDLEELENFINPKKKEVITEPIKSEEKPSWENPVLVAGDKIDPDKSKLRYTINPSNSFKDMQTDYIMKRNLWDEEQVVFTNPWEEVQGNFRKLIKENREEKLHLRAREIYALLVGTGKKRIISRVVNFNNLVELLDDGVSTDFFITLIDNNIDLKKKYLERRLENLNKSKNKLEEDLSVVVSNQWGVLNDKLSIVELRIASVSMELEDLEDIESYKLSKLKISKNLTDKVGKVSSYEYLEDYFERFKMFVNEIWEDACKEHKELLDSPNELKLLYVILKGGRSIPSFKNALRLRKILRLRGRMTYLERDNFVSLGTSCFIAAIGDLNKARELSYVYESQLRKLSISRYQFNSETYMTEKEEVNAFSLLTKGIQILDDIKSAL